MRILHLYLTAFGIFSFLFVHSQTVTPWLTRGDQNALLAQQTAVAFSSNSSSFSNVITFNENTTYQEVDGFGFCLTQGSAEVINSLASSERAALLNELFGSNGLGISALRISIGASDLSNSTYTYNETSGDVNMTNFSLAGPDLTHLIPVLQDILAINPNLIILATPWTAPTWMKTNGTWIGGSLNPTYYDAYSLYFVKYLQAMQSNGIDIWGITPQNEPENPFNEPSMLMNATEQITFINNHLGPDIQQAGFSTKIIAFDHNCDNTAYPISVLNNSSYAVGAAFHLYAGDISAMSTVKNATNKDVYFTEQFTSSNGNFNGDFSWHVRNIVMGSLNNWSKTIFEWNLASDANYGPRTPGGCSECLGAITINNSTSYTKNVSYYIIGQIAKFVAPGALKIDAVSNNSNLSTTALRNTDGSITLLVYNNRQKTEKVHITDGSNGFEYSIPKKSAVSFVWSSTAPPPTPPNAPSNLSATTVSTSAIDIDWTDNSNNENSFELQRSLDGNSNWQTVGNLGANTTTTTDNGLSAGTTYYYRIRTVNTAGSSSWSNTASATTQTGSGSGNFSGTYNIIAEHSNKGLDVVNFSGNNNANVQQWEVLNGGGDNQRWQLSDNGNGTYEIQVVHSGKCLAILRPNKTNVVQQNCDGGSKQSWTLTDVGGGYYELENAANGLVLGVENSDTNNGANVETQSSTGGTNQKWRFDAIVGARIGITPPAELIIYPNPVVDKLSVVLPYALEANGRLELYDLRGRKLQSYRIDKNSDSTIALNVSNLPSGIFLVKWTESGILKATKKFVVE